MFDERFIFHITNNDLDNFLIKIENKDIESINESQFEGIIKKAIHIFSMSALKHSLFDNKYFQCVQFKRGNYHSIFLEIDMIETADESKKFIDIYCYSFNNVLIGKGCSMIQLSDYSKNV